METLKDQIELYKDGQMLVNCVSYPYLHHFVEDHYANDDCLWVKIGKDYVKYDESLGGGAFDEYDAGSKFKPGDKVVYRGVKTTVRSLCMKDSPIGDYFLDSLAYAKEDELRHDISEPTVIRGETILERSWAEMIKDSIEDFARNVRFFWWMLRGK